jgi:purine-binding chemotaxis protein CheW
MAENTLLYNEVSIVDTQKDKYLTFHLAGEDYGIEIKFVTEIVGLQDITEVPDLANYIKGVINLRGKVIPVIDVRLRFLIEKRDYDSRTCIIIINLAGSAVGLIVDEVSEVINIPFEQIDEPPRTMRGTKSRFIQGFGKVGNKVKMILDIDKFLNSDELEELDGIDKKI